VATHVLIHTELRSSLKCLQKLSHNRFWGSWRKPTASGKSVKLTWWIRHELIKRVTTNKIRFGRKFKDEKLLPVKLKISIMVELSNVNALRLNHSSWNTCSPWKYCWMNRTSFYCLQSRGRAWATTIYHQRSNNNNSFKSWPQDLKLYEDG